MAEVDFTKDHIFGQKETKARALGLLKLFGGDEFPWQGELQRNRSDQDSLEVELFATGTAEEIIHKHYILEMCAGATCVRCGAPLIQFPWLAQRELCQKCWHEMDLEYKGPFPWSLPKPEPSDDGWWIDL